MYVLKKGGAKAKKVAPGAKAKKKPAPKPHKKAQPKGEHKPRKKPAPKPAPKKAPEPARELKTVEPTPVEPPKVEAKLLSKVEPGPVETPVPVVAPEKTPEPEKAPPSSCVGLMVLGDAKVVPDDVHHRFLPRRSRNGVLQVVPEPREILNIKWGMESPEEWGKNEEVFEALRGRIKPNPRVSWANLKEASRDLDHRWKEVEAAKKKSPEWELDGEVVFKLGWLSKKAKVVVIADFAHGDEQDVQNCTVRNEKGRVFPTKPLDGKELEEYAGYSARPEEMRRRGWTVDLEHVDNGTGMGAKPTRYRVVVKGGDGKEKTAAVELFPATVGTFEASLGGKSDRKDNKSLGTLNNWLGKLSKDADPAKLSFSMGGGFELFWGWKEELQDYGEESQVWRAAHVIESSIGFKPLIAAKATLTVSAMQILFGMPQCLTEHLADVRLDVGLSGSISMVGMIEQKTLPGGKQFASGGPKGTGNITFSLELYAFVGSKILVQVEGRVGVRTGITVEGAILFSHESIDVKHSGQWDGVSVDVKLTTYYLVYGSHEWEAGKNTWQVFDKAVLWDKRTVLKEFESRKIEEGAGGASGE